MKFRATLASIFLFFATAGLAFGNSLTVSAPTNNAWVLPTCQFVANASSPAGVSSMTLNIDSQDRYKTGGGYLNTTISNLSPGQHKVVVKAWDNQGNYFDQWLTINVWGTTTTTSTSTSSTSVSTSNTLTVSAPTNGATVASTVQFVASASSPNGVSSMTLNIDSQDRYKTGGGYMNTTISGLGTGKHQVVVKAWDNKGNYFDKWLTIYVGTSGTTSTSTSTSGTTVSGATTFYSLEEKGGWGSCTVCAGAGGNGPAATYYMKQWVTNPVLDHYSAEFHIGGSTPYADVLWNQHLINSSVENYRNFKYDVYFYLTNLHAAQALEFDINQFVGGKSYIWGTQCRVLGGNQWDTWDNWGHYWKPTGVGCYPNAYAWNHLIVEVQRTWDNKLLYVAITLNGTKHYLNRYDNPTGSSWYGVTQNFQMDGNYKQEAYSVWLDKFNFSAW